MSTLLLVGIALTGFLGAGLGTMVGMGGGTFVVPILVVALGIDIGPPSPPGRSVWS